MVCLPSILRISSIMEGQSWYEEHEVVTHSQEAEREMCADCLWSAGFILFMQPKMPIHGMVLSKFKADFPRAINIIQKVPPRCA